MRAMSIAFALCLYAATGTYAVQQPKGVASEVVAGSVLNTDESPVELSEARYTLEKQDTPWRTLELNFRDFG